MPVCLYACVSVCVFLPTCVYAYVCVYFSAANRMFLDLDLPTPLRDRVEQLALLRAGPRTIRKVVKQRIITLFMHPQEPLVFAADKSGHLGFSRLSVSAEGGEEEGVQSESFGGFHDRGITGMELSRSHPGRLLTSSYDRTLRTVDIESLSSDVLFEDGGSFPLWLVAEEDRLVTRSHPLSSCACVLPHR